MQPTRWPLYAAMLAGICLPLPGTAQTAASADSTSTLTQLLHSLKQWAGWKNAEKPLLPPEAAFKLSVKAMQPNTLVATLVAAEDYYLYRDRMAFRIEHPAGVTIKNIVLPPGQPKQDPTFGSVDVYYGTIKIDIQLNQSIHARNGPIQLHAAYQGCNDSKGVCYPPVETVVVVRQK